MDIEEVIQRIANTLRQCEGEQVAQFYNDLCDDSIIYLGDSQFEEFPPPT